MSKRIPFNVKFRPQIESGDYKVETRDGKPVRIICWDMDSYNHIVALVANYPNYNGSLSEHIFSYGMDGRYSATAENAEDLFIVTPEPEMSEFENGMLRYLQDAANKKEDSEIVESTKEHSIKLLELAKRQLLQSGELMTQEHHEKLMETLREECKKGLPRWRKAKAGTKLPCASVIRPKGDDQRFGVVAVFDSEYITINDLNRLPKEEDHE